MAETLDLSALPGFTHRRHGARRGQQPDRVHHRAAERPLAPRYATDVAKMVQAPDLPRERRRPRGVRVGDAAGPAVPAGVQEGRGDRPGVLPPVRAQRGRRPELHAAAHVRGDRAGAARSASCTWRSSSTGATSRSRKPRPRSRSTGEHMERGLRRDEGEPATHCVAEPRRRPSRSACCPPVETGVAAGDARPHPVGPPPRGPTASRVHPKLGPPARDARRRRSRRTPSTGPPARRWRSARWCWRGRRSGSPDRTSGAGRSASGTRC